MRLLPLLAATGIIATISLIVVLMNRRTGFGSIGAFLYATAAYGIAWLATAVVLMALVNQGAFDWLPESQFLHYSVVLLVHTEIWYDCLRGAIAFTNSGFQETGWVCLGLATAPPVAVHVTAVVRQ